MPADGDGTHVVAHRWASATWRSARQRAWRSASGKYDQDGCVRKQVRRPVSVQKPGNKPGNDIRTRNLFWFYRFVHVFSLAKGLRRAVRRLALRQTPLVRLLEAVVQRLDPLLALALAVDSSKRAHTRGRTASAFAHAHDRNPRGTTYVILVGSARRKKVGAISASHLGSTASTSRMYSLVVSTSSW